MNLCYIIEVTYFKNSISSRNYKLINHKIKFGGTLWQEENYLKLLELLL
jgi:hypothetical protein